MNEKAQTLATLWRELHQAQKLAVVAFDRSDLAEAELDTAARALELIRDATREVESLACQAIKNP